MIVFQLGINVKHKERVFWAQSRHESCCVWCDIGTENIIQGDEEL